MRAQGKAVELARAIIESNECRKVLSLKKVIDNNPEYKNKIRTLKGVQENIKSTIASGKQPNKAHTENLKSLYNEIMKNHDMKDYLEAERAFNEYISKMFQIIGDKINEGLK